MIEAPGPIALRQKNIFLVDDHPLVREGLVKVIEREPDLVVCAQAESVGEAYDAIERIRPDAVLVDISLGGESGLDLIKRLRTLANPPPVLVVSMHDEAHYAERALRAGALGYVMKRESAGKIVEGIRRVMDGRVYLSDRVAMLLAEAVAGRRGNDTTTPVERLTDRELEIFRRIGLGHENRRIAEDLHLSLKTVQTHCAHIKDKFGLANAAELMREAVRWGENERRGAAEKI